MYITFQANELKYVAMRDTQKCVSGQKPMAIVNPMFSKKKKQDQKT